MTSLAAWARAYVLSDDLATKLDPPAPPRPPLDGAPAPRLERPLAPGRPAALRVMARVKSPRGSLVDPKKRAHLVHTFLHHELQAAELMAAMLVAFPDAPRAFQVGLVRVFFDEIRHMQGYRAHLERLGFAVGDFPVRDWFWERLGAVPSLVSFVAAMGVGFEGGNLDHTRRYAEAFDAAGDHDGARLVRRVGEEEIVHVRFALAWLPRLLGKTRVSFDDFAAALPPPLTPSVMQGPVMDRVARVRAGYTEEFLDALVAFAAAHPSGARSPTRDEARGPA